ncbi:MAG: hypothetical protein RR806_07455 [Oscillospiraceae bacterium]
MAVSRQERLVKSWVKNDNLSLIDMYNKCYEEGWMDYLVGTQEDIREFIADKVRNGDCPCAKTLADIESDTRAELFKFDASCWGFGAAPIYDKEELAEAMGY